MTEYKQEDVELQENDEEETPSSNEQGDSLDGDSDEPDYKALYEQTNSELEKVRKDKNGLIKKVSKVKSQPKSNVIDDSRLDKIELRQLDNSLTTDAIENILTIKQAKGYADVSEALNDPMVKAFLDSTRSEQAHEDKIKKATPKPTQKGGSVPSAKPKVNKSGNWFGNTPSSLSNRELGNVLEEAFFGDK